MEYSEKIDFPENKPAKLIFEFGIENEESRVKYTLENTARYKGANYLVILPKKLTLDEANLLKTEELRNFITQEYDPIPYETAKKAIEFEWPEKFKILKRGLETYGLQPDNEYKIILTRYGVGGSYDSGSSPKAVINNIGYKKDHSAIETVCHEIVHLCIDAWIKKYQVPQQLKERIVDLIMKDIFGDKQLQKIDPELGDKINRLFESAKDNIEEFIKQVGNLNL